MGQASRLPGVRSQEPAKPRPPVAEIRRQASGGHTALRGGEDRSVRGCGPCPALPEAARRDRSIAEVAALAGFWDEWSLQPRFPAERARPTPSPAPRPPPSPTFHTLALRLIPIRRTRLHYSFLDPPLPPPVRPPSPHKPAAQASVPVRYGSQATGRLRARLNDSRHRGFIERDNSL